MRNYLFPRSFVLVCLFAMLTINRAIAETKSVESDAPMNVVFILSDDHRYDFMGFTGKVPWLKTPGMDQMAEEGSHFRNAYVTTSLCSPSRASILTGLYSHNHTIVDNQAPEPEGLVYFPSYLQAAGYQTSFFGKWHMGDHGDQPRPGFDHWESFKGQGVYYGVTLNTNGERITYGDDVYTTDLLTEHAEDWIKNRDKQKPFFVYLSHKAVHAEFAPAKRHKGMYAGNKAPLPPTYEQTKTGEYRALKWPEWVAQQRISWHGVDYMYHQNDSLDQKVIDYCETLMGVDDSIRSVLDFLKKEGLSENTVVIYMGDNGFSWGEHGLIDKRHFYEESGKVPLLVLDPRHGRQGQKVDQLVQNVDIAPTVLELAGVEKPEQMVGKSFVQLLEGDSEDWRQQIFYEYFWENDFPMTPTVFGVRTERYKYIRYHGIWDWNELYDLQEDPNEMFNLIDQPEQQERVLKMAEDLTDWLETTDGMQIPLKPNLRYRWGDYRHPVQY